MDEAADPLIGTSVGNLVLVAKLGSGGMGTVYRGEHRALKTPYAVKVLHPQFSQNPDTVERFRREAVACSQLRHENVVFVTDFGVQDGLGIYIVMEYLEGESLKDVYRKAGRIPVGRLGRIADQVCEAMAAAHRLDIVHRDLKPDNIVVLRDRRDFVKVLDFGIAQVRGARGDDLTAPGMTAGTPAYISPEQVMAEAGAIGPASDIYSLGVMFFELLSGALPFQRGESDFSLMSAHVTQPAPLLSTRYPAMAGTKLESLIGAMLEKKPPRRPGSMIEVKARLAEAIRELQERGDPDAFYEGDGAVPVAAPLAPSGPHPAAENQSSPSLHITSLVRAIQKDAPESPAAMLLRALPNADRLGGEALALALWGVLQQELLDAPVEGERFKQALRHFTLLMEAVIFAHGGSTPTESQEKVFRSLKNLLTLAPRERQPHLLDALQNLVHHPLFPREALPKDKGNWLKSVMQKEIRLFSDARKEAPPVQRPAPPAPRPGGAPTDPAFRVLYDKGMNFYLQEKFEDAIRELKAAYFIKPYTPILFTIGGAYRALQIWEDALEYYERYQRESQNLGAQAKAKLEGFIAEAKAQLGRPAEEPGPGATPAPGCAAGSALGPPGPGGPAAAAAFGAAPDGEPVLVLESEITHGRPPAPLPAVDNSASGEWLSGALGSAARRPESAAPRPGATTPAPAAAARPAHPSPPSVPPQVPTAQVVSPPPPPPQEDPFDLHYRRATALAREGRYQEAIGDYAAAYRIEQDPALVFHIAWAYRALGQPADALRFFLRYQQEAGELSPNAQARLLGLIAEAQRLLQPNRPAPAPAAAPAPPEPPPPPPPAPEPPALGVDGKPPLPPEAVVPVPATGSYADHHGRALSLHKAGQYEGAIRQFLCAYQVRPVAALLFNIAATYRIMKRPRAALYYFDRFAEEEQDLPEAMQIKLSNLRAEARSEIEAQQGGGRSPFFGK